jgi:hypothetical protein
VEKEASELELSATQSAAANAKVSFINWYHIKSKIILSITFSNIDREEA